MFSVTAMTKGRTVRRIWVISSLVLVSSLCALGQSNDIALTGGGMFAFTNPLDLGAAWGLEGTFAHRIAGPPVLAISFEVPVAGSFSSSIPTLSGVSIARSYTSLLVTPGIRLKLAPSFPLSPYFSAGLGYGRFHHELFNGSSATNASFAFDVGGGLDLKILPFVGLRGEIRDFNSGGLDIATFAFGRQNSLFVTAGVVVRF
jgi:opacity protein-like surface antigen